MDSDVTQEPVPPKDTFFSDPVYSHRDVYLAYKVLIKQIAERLVEEDLKKIRHFCDLPPTANSTDSLEILTQLEKKGQFSYANVDPLKDLLQNIDRCDLVNQFVDPFKLRYSSSVVVDEKPTGTQSLPLGSLSGYSALYDTACPSANGSEEKSWPYATYPSNHRHRSLTPGYSSRPSSRPNLSCVTEDVFLLPPTDAIPPGLPHPRAASSAGVSSYSPTEYAHREHRQHQQCTAGLDMSLSSSIFRTGSTYCSSTTSPVLPIHTEERYSSQHRYRKAAIGQQTTTLCRKKMINCIRDHRYDKNITVCHRLTLNLGCKYNPQLGFKVWPCGLDDDKDESVTLQADVYFPSKCSAAVVRSIVKLTVTATDKQTGKLINSCSDKFSLGSLSITMYDFIRHTTLIRSKSLTIGLRVEAEVLEFHPQQTSEADFSMEEVHSPMAQYQQEDGETLVNINPHSGNRPIPEMQ